MPAVKKPTALHVIEGTYRADRHEHDEPKPRPLMPACPVGLKGEAAKCWKRLAPICYRMGTLTEADGEAFTALCISWADMIHNYRIVEDWKKRSRAKSKENGSMYLGAVAKTQTGYLQQIPEVAMMRQAMKEFRSWCGQFGLTPSARTGIIVGGDDSEDDMENLLSGR